MPAHPKRSVALGAIAIAIAVVTTALVVWLGARQRSVAAVGSHPSIENAAPAPAHDPATTTRPAQRAAAPGPSLAHVTLDPPPNIEADSPTRDGWTTETVTEELNARLKRLGVAITRRDAAGIATLLAQSPSVVGLPRAAGVTTPSERLIAVERRAAASTRTAGKTPVAQLIANLGGAAALGQPHIKFKLDRIEVAAGVASIQTRVILQWHPTCGAKPCPRVERHSVWQSRWRLEPATRAHRIEHIAFGPATIARTRGGALFEDVTGAVLAPVAAQATLLADADTWLQRVDNAHTSDPIGHQGLAVGDVNGDGRDDLYVCAPSGVPNRLLIQQPDGTVVDTALTAGVAVLDLSRSALFADFDNDGDQDLVVATRATDTPKGTSVLLFENDGAAHFKKARVILHGGDVHSLAAADFDSDGDLDLYACLLNADKRIVGGLGIPVPYHDATNGGHNVLLANVGALTFRDVTKQVGLDVANSRWSYAASWEDFDNDGDMDLYVANDFGKNNLYRNDHGRFTDVAASAGVEDVAASMSVTWGDVDRDGDMDLYVSNMYSSAGRRIAAQPRFLANAPAATRQQFLRHSRGNTLFRNNGDGTFTDVAEASGTNVARWAWGSLLADLDGDGWPDALVVNGMFTRRDEHDL